MINEFTHGNGDWQFKFVFQRLIFCETLCRLVRRIPNLDDWRIWGEKKVGKIHKASGLCKAICPFWKSLFCMTTKNSIERQSLCRSGRDPAGWAEPTTPLQIFLLPRDAFRQNVPIVSSLSAPPAIYYHPLPRLQHWFDKQHSELWHR